LGGAGVGFLTTLGVGIGVRFFCPTPTPEAQLDRFTDHTPKVGNPYLNDTMSMKLFLKQIILAAYHDFH